MKLSQIQSAKNILTGLGILSVLTAPSLALSGETLKVTIRESVTLSGDSLKFSDIIDSENTDIDFVKKYGAIKVTDSQDDDARLDRTRLISLLFKAGAPVEDIRLVMSQAVDVERGQKIELKDEQHNQIIRLLGGDYGVPAADIKIGEAAILPKISDEQKQLLHFKSVKPQDLSRLSRAAFQVVMLDDDGLDRKYTLYISLGIETQVAQAQKDMSVGDVLTADDYVLGRQKLASLSGKLVQQKDIKDGTIKVIQSIDRDQILTSGLVRLAQRVKEGTTVTLSYKTAFINVKTVGVIKEGGEIGEMVRVENSDSQQTVTGRLISKDTVEVARVEKE